jgi:hypothetical protein
MPDLGGKWVREPKDDTCIVFMHGILSDGERAWTNGNGMSWPQLLAQEPSVKDIGIYVFSYRSDLFCRTYSLKDVADSIREYFFRLDALCKYRRVVFVCHSMGGIAVRKFIVANQLKLVQHKIELGLFLLASPSLGSQDANAVWFFARLIRSSQAEALRFSQSNVWLNELNDDFRTLKESGTLRIKGKELVEDEPITIKNVLGFTTQTVEPWSAATYFGEPYKIPHSDHVSIAKPKDEYEPQHRQLVHFIKDMRIASSFCSPERPYPFEPYERDEAKRMLGALDEGVAAGRAIPREVLVALNAACMETRRYIVAQRSGAARDRETEQSLSSLWIEAGQALWSYDHELAGRCVIKGNGWADETVWDDPRFRDLPLRLNDMLVRAMEVGGPQRGR